MCAAVCVNQVQHFRPNMDDDEVMAAERKGRNDSKETETRSMSFKIVKTVFMVLAPAVMVRPDLT